MGAHEGWHQADRLFSLQLPYHFKLLDFVLKIQAVTALGLDRGRPVEQHGFESLPAEVFEFLPAGFPGGPDRGLDAQAHGRQLLVGISLQAQGEFLLPVAGKRQVSMAINQAGQPDQAPAIYDRGLLGQLDLFPEFFFRPSKNDFTLAAGNPGFFQETDFPHGRSSPGGRSPAGQELVEAGYHQVSAGHWAFSLSNSAWFS